MAQSGIALTPEQSIDIVSMYSSAAQSIFGVASEPGWTVVGAFYMPVTANIRLDVIGSVSDSSLIMTTRLFCTSVGFEGEILGSRAIVGSTIDDRQLSSAFDLTGGRLYQVQTQVVGNAGDDYFGIVRRAAPIGST
jgi:hypothetical protein